MVRSIGSTIVIISLLTIITVNVILNAEKV